MTRPRMRLSGPVLDSADPVRLVKFYEQLLGWPISDCVAPKEGEPAYHAWAKVRSPAGDQKIEIQGEQHYLRPVWPTVDGEPQMMIHLDIAVDDLDAGVAWALDAGATVAAHQPQKGVRVMLDPDGH